MVKLTLGLEEIRRPGRNHGARWLKSTILNSDLLSLE